jgi:hypothetical protein
MPRPKGLPKTGGRAPGVPNKATVARRSAMKEAEKRLAEVMPEVKDLTAHGLLRAVYSNPEFPIELRLEAARSALKVETPSLSAVSASINHGDVGKIIDARIASAKQLLAEALADNDSVPLAALVTVDADGVPDIMLVESGVPAPPAAQEPTVSGTTWRPNRMSPPPSRGELKSAYESDK